MVERPNEDVPLFSKRMLEGEYAAWNFIWSRDYGAGVNFNEIVVDNYGTVHAEDVATNIAYVRTFAGVETTLANYMFRIWQRVTSVSVTGKYFLGMEQVAFLDFEVWRDGVRIFNRDVSLDEPNANGLYYASLSPNGKFVAVIVTRLVTFNEQIMMLYEGV